MTDTTTTTPDPIALVRAELAELRAALAEQRTALALLEAVIDARGITTGRLAVDSVLVGPADGPHVVLWASRAGESVDAHGDVPAQAGVTVMAAPDRVAVELQGQLRPDVTPAYGTVEVNDGRLTEREWLLKALQQVDPRRDEND